MENIFVEFLPPWVETGLQPAFYDKESGSVLQQTARMYARVNMLIRMFNKLSKNTKETVENYINQFNELHTYVHDYFDNLDVQNEINNKIDAMYDDGSLAEILKGLINNIYYPTTTAMLQFQHFMPGDIVNTLGYNEIGDGGASTFIITDDSLITDNKSVYEVNDELYAVLKPVDHKVNVMQFGITNKENYNDDFDWLAEYISNNKIAEVNFNEETYKVTKYITFNVTSNDFTMNFNNGTVKLDASFRYYNNGIFTIVMDKTKNTSCTIINGNFDGSGNPADFSNLNVNPKGGRGMFFINGARYIKADNLNFNDWFYSACIWTHYCKDGSFTNITGIRVGGRSADNTEDARGDALYFGYCGVVEDGEGVVDVDNSLPVNINIENCHFESWPAIPTLYPGAGSNEGRNGCQSGRAGIVLGEYSKTNANKVFNINNCYFYNYQRSLHIEEVDNITVNIVDSTFKDYGQVLLATGHSINGINFNNCNITKNVNVIAIYNGYQYIVSGFTNNNIKYIVFNNCYINDNYNGVQLLGKDVDIQFNHCNITLEKLNSSNYCYLKFYDSTIKYNTTNLYLSGFVFEKCNITGGYKQDSNSKTFIYTTADSSFNYNNYVINCKTSNVGYHVSRKVSVTDSELNFDNNFINVDQNGVIRNYFLSVYGDRLEKFSNNIVINTNTTVNQLYDTANNGTFEISNNRLTNIRAGLINGTGYKVSVHDNVFINDNSGISDTTAVSDLYGSKCLWYNNKYLGYGRAMSNYGSAVQYNNYLSTDGDSATVVS